MPVARGGQPRRTATRGRPRRAAAPAPARLAARKSVPSTADAPSDSENESSSSSSSSGSGSSISRSSGWSFEDPFEKIYDLSDHADDSSGIEEVVVVGSPPRQSDDAAELDDDLELVEINLGFVAGLATTVLQRFADAMASRDDAGARARLKKAAALYRADFHGKIEPAVALSRQDIAALRHGKSARTLLQAANIAVLLTGPYEALSVADLALLARGVAEDLASAAPAGSQGYLLNAAHSLAKLACKHGASRAALAPFLDAATNLDAARGKDFTVDVINATKASPARANTSRPSLTGAKVKLPVGTREDMAVALLQLVPHLLRRKTARSSSPRGPLEGYPSIDQEGADDLFTGDLSAAATTAMGSHGGFINIDEEIEYWADKQAEIQKRIDAREARPSSSYAPPSPALKKLIRDRDEIADKLRSLQRRPTRSPLSPSRPKHAVEVVVPTKSPVHRPRSHSPSTAHRAAGRPIGTGFRERIAFSSPMSARASRTPSPARRTKRRLHSPTPPEEDLADEETTARKRARRAESGQSGSPSRPRGSPASVAPAASAAPAASPPRRTGRQYWTPDEEAALEEAMEQHGTKWATIEEKYGRHGNRRLSRFGQVAYKDKARNVAARRRRRGEPLGIFVLATQYPDRALH